MLRIKDNVDLKELEKFGFSKKINPYSKSAYYIDSKESCVFYEKSRKITQYYIFKSDLLFDLIQAGLVEKVNTDD